ncbi:hypothetical protein G6F57_022598 [Rhizopus arrhizus]|nr:hypothetical protein G6F57_022598 [Rhizopus arrhizus]
MKGDPNALQLVQTLAENVDASKGSTPVEVPKNATAGSDYSLAVGKDSSQMAYIGGLVLSSDGGSNSTASGASASSVPMLMVPTTALMLLRHC